MSGDASNANKPRFSKDEFYILDGGFGTHLSRILEDEEKGAGSKLNSDPLWSCRSLKTNPSAVVRTHLDFIRAGANIVTTNTYQASAELLGKHLDFADPILGPHLLIESAPKLARQAVAASGRADTIVAGSVGPYGACLGDGSEYTGAYVDSVTAPELREWHSDRIRRLRVQGVDLFAVETIPSVVEALAVLDVLEEIPGSTCWISFQCRDGGKATAKGEPLTEAFERLGAHPAFWHKVVAVGANCVRPRDVEKILGEFNKVNHWSRWPGIFAYEKVPYVVYPNAGRRFDPEAKRFEGESRVDDVLDGMKRWMSMGANVIGGCCQVGPSDLARMRDRMMLDMFEAGEERRRAEEAARDDRGDWKNVLERLKKPSYEELKKRQAAMGGFVEDLTGDGGVGAFSRLHHEMEHLVVGGKKAGGES